MPDGRPERTSPGVRDLISPQRAPVILRPLFLPGFRLMWLAEILSVFADNIHYVALTWLSLQVTGSGLAVGSVLMASASPRAIFMVVGGAASDRFSPRALMLYSNVARALLVGVLTALVAAGAVQLWQLFVIAVLFGFVDAFFYPAVRTIVPMLVDTDQLQPANALIQGTVQVGTLAAPAVAGVVIAAGGMSFPFGLGTAGFALSALALAMMPGHALRSRHDEPSLDEGRGTVALQPSIDSGTGLLATIAEGMRYAWSDPVTRVLLLIVAVIDFAFVGPVDVGLATLADRRFDGGAVAFGSMLSAFGGGALLGTIIGGSLSNPRRRGLVLIGLTAILGVCFALVGFAPGVLVAAALMAAIGMGSGFANIVFISWLQVRTPAHMMGRVMSLVMLASVGVTPISYAVAGALVDLHATVMFLAAGLLVVLAALVAAMSRTVRSID